MKQPAITGMRILNIALIAVAALRLRNMGLFAGKEPEVLAVMLSSEGIRTLAPLMTLAATRQAASARLRGAARILNAVMLALAALGHTVQISMGLGSPYLLLGWAMGASPFLFNFWAIGQLPRRSQSLSDPPQPTVDGLAPAAGPEVIEQDPSLAAPSIHPPKPSYWRRHWSGNLPLPVSYWVNGSLVALLFWQMDVALNVLPLELPMRIAAWMDLAFSVFYLAVTLWSIVGICRSAIKYPAQGGKRGWAGAALVMAALATWNVAIGMWGSVPRLQESAAVAIGRDPLGWMVELELTEDGSGLMLSGLLGMGSAQDVRRVLSKSPGVRTLLLHSEGGNTDEGEAIAELIRARKLDTYVEANCESACTFIFLAGRNRIATPTAEIGFHKPHVDGLNRAQQLQAVADVMQIYRKAGLPEQFIEHVERTAAEDMWYPSHLELMDNSVITRVTASGAFTSTAALSRWRSEFALALRREPLMAAIERRFPGTFDRTVAVAWQGRERGASHGDIDSTARAALASILPKLLDLATDEQLLTYQIDLVGRLNAARAMSEDACALLIASKPGVEELLPASVLQQHTLWAIEVLEGRLELRQPISSARSAAAIRQATAGVSPPYSAVIDNMREYSDAPGVQCDAMLAFYDSVLRLPSDTRAAALRGLFQSTPK